MKEEYIYILNEIRNDYNSFNFLIMCFNKVSTIENKTIYFDFKNTIWFDANLSSVMGTIFMKGFENNNTIFVNNLNNSIKTIFKKNNFYKRFGLGKDVDIHNSTIKYTDFNSDDRNGFSEYVKKELIPKIDEKVNMTPEFKLEFRRALEELFQNARTHGHCGSVITCKQYYPTYKYIYFTIIDLGITMLNNVSKKLQIENLNGVGAIAWATIEGNTTRVNGETGGMGLPLIRDFLKNNNGRLEIISSDGYWEEDCGEICMDSFENKFPGTIVNIKVNMNDNNFYMTRNEKDAHKFVENIF